ncbi:MAG: cytochrome c3 family protein, partial [Planctomycetota bacterium]
MKRIENRLVRYLVTSFGALVILALLVLGTTQVTSKPKFCSTCHYMKPYVEAWEVSSHLDVTCTDCHFPPGFKHKMKGKFTALSMLVNYFTGVYKKSKPWAEISDESCLRSGCHIERLLDNEVIFKKGILFNHQPHLTELRRDKKLRCTSCHSQIVQGEHITVTESTCFLCHFKNQPMEVPIDDCNWCHNAPVKDSGGEVNYDHTFVVEKEMNCEKCHGGMQIGDGTVPVERCSSCHAEIGHLDYFSDAAFIHKHHVTDHKVECQNCHLVIQHKSMSNLAEGIQDCNSCHDNTHNTQRLLFSGSGGMDIPSHPNPMFKTGLNCQGCHLFHNVEWGYDSLGQSSLANAES